MRTALGVAALTVATLAAQTAERVDTDAISKIREEGLKRSQVMEHMFWLTDAYGPRLTGSPGFEQAGDWAVKTLQSWGLQNVRKERFAFGKGWSLVKFHATMTAPQVMPIIGLPKAWTPGTSGLVTADVVRPQIANAAEAEKYKGQLRGKIVLTQPARAVRMLDERVVLRMNDKDIEEALAPPAPRGGGAGRAGQADPAAAGRAGGAGAAGGRGGAGRGGGAAAAPAFDVNEFYKDEGVVALFDRGANSDMSAGGSDLTWQTQRTDGGTVFVGSGGGRAAGSPVTVLPQVTLTVEHYNRLVRLLEHNVPVKVELNIEATFHDEGAGANTANKENGFNIIGEFPGTDLAKEIVLIGGHFDSWHGATGATDNAAGSAAMMEVLRIYRTAGLKPRRTIRIALWGAEEQGLIGSRLYAERYLGTVKEPKPEHALHSAYFNIDNGTGKIRGIWLQSNEAVRPIFAEWIKPLKDLGVEILGPRSVGSTDHASIDNAGVPGFQFVQERYEYNSRTHHSNMDYYDRVQVEDMKQMATVAAVFIWHAANRNDKLPRKPLAAGGE
ncbi:MAG TPA: M20/M25/M40 family metallo-hydrolase [Vicinamibacterales bacterium]|nr:M20/M25/M40 family metallo-hydrolase [Vicinamibacterales bacterium]